MLDFFNMTYLNFIVLNLFVTAVCYMVIDWLMQEPIWGKSVRYKLTEAWRDIDRLKAYNTSLYLAKKSVMKDLAEAYDQVTVLAKENASLKAKRRAKKSSK